MHRGVRIFQTCPLKKVFLAPSLNGTKENEIQILYGKLNKKADMIKGTNQSIL